MKTTLTLGCLVFAISACGSDGVTVTDSGTSDTGSSNDSGNAMDVANSDTGTSDSGSDGSMDDGSSDGGDAGKFDVSKVPCLVLWLDAAKGVTQINNAVSAWADQSPNNNNANQAIPLRQPTLQSNTINGLPAIHFNQGQNTGNQLSILDSQTLQFGMGDFSIFAVAKFNNNPQNGQSTGVGVLFSKMTSGGTPVGPMLLANNGANPNNLAAGLTGAVGGNGNFVGHSTSYNDNVAREYAVRRTGTVIELRVNGQQVAMMNQSGSVDVSASGTNARIGADGDASTRRLNGDIAEIIACKGMIAGPDLAGIEAYLKTKYAL